MAWLVPRVHGTAAMKGMETDDLLCSHNARPQKALARAHGMSRRAGVGRVRSLAFLSIQQEMPCYPRCADQ